MSFDRKAYQREYMREYMRKRRAAERQAAQLSTVPAPVKPASSDRREYQREYQRRYRERKSVAALAQHQDRIRVNADAIAAYVQTQMGGSCRPSKDAHPILTALRLEFNDWTPAIMHLEMHGRARWFTPASLLESRVLFLT